MPALKVRWVGIVIAKGMEPREFRGDGLGINAFGESRVVLKTGSKYHLIFTIAGKSREKIYIR